MKHEFSIFIENKGAWLSPELINKIETFFKLSDSNLFELTIKPIKSKRSSAQNRFYWSAIMSSLIKASAGTNYAKYTAETWHEVLKEAFLRHRHPVSNRWYTRSTTDLSVDEFSQYLEDIINLVLIEKLNGYLEDSHMPLYKESRGL